MKSKKKIDISYLATGLILSFLVIIDFYEASYLI